VSIAFVRGFAEHALKLPWTVRAVSKDGVVVLLNAVSTNFKKCLDKQQIFWQRAQYSCSINVSKARCVWSHCLGSPAPSLAKRSNSPERTMSQCEGQILYSYITKIMYAYHAAAFWDGGRTGGPAETREYCVKVNPPTDFQPRHVA
jgi:hypothetical protein